MTRKLTDEEKAARAAARRDADAQRKASHAETKAAAEAGRPFNARSTRESVRRSLFQDAALTLEQYRIAEARHLVGSGLTNESVEAMPIAYEGPHQVRWDPSSWHGFTRMSMSRQINNANDTYSPWSADDYEEPGSSIDETVVADEEVFNAWQDDAFWTDPGDIYDSMSDLFGVARPNTGQVHATCSSIQVDDRTMSDEEQRRNRNSEPPRTARYSRGRPPPCMTACSS